mmetsp:Transcript_59816/g.185647  ORF Transcript_59816/g.185647 Transcript_59816/m.185647 type:complete len:302 (-) Transcript_59816:27-932(-)
MSRHRLPVTSCPRCCSPRECCALPQGEVRSHPHSRPLAAGLPQAPPFSLTFRAPRFGGPLAATCNRRGGLQPGRAAASGACQAARLERTDQQPERPAARRGGHRAAPGRPEPAAHRWGGRRRGLRPVCRAGAEAVRGPALQLPKRQAGVAGCGREAIAEAHVHQPLPRQLRRPRHTADQAEAEVHARPGQPCGAPGPRRCGRWRWPVASLGVQSRERPGAAAWRLGVRRATAARPRPRRWAEGPGRPAATWPPRWAGRRGQAWQSRVGGHRAPRCSGGPAASLLPRAHATLSSGKAADGGV